MTEDRTELPEGWEIIRKATWPKWALQSPSGAIVNLPTFSRLAAISAAWNIVDAERAAQP